MIDHESATAPVRNGRANIMLIPGKVFLVTGGGSGLGAAVARLLVEAGARIIAAVRQCLRGR